MAFDIYSYLDGPQKSTGVAFPMSGGNYQSPSSQVPTELSTPSASPLKSTDFDWGGKGGANVSAGIQGVGSLANAFMAYKQYQLGKKTLSQNKAAFNLNSANQAKVTNAQIDDRARRRALENQSIAGDLDAIAAATEKEAAPRRVSGQGI